MMRRVVTARLAPARPAAAAAAARWCAAATNASPSAGAAGESPAAEEQRAAGQRAPRRPLWRSFVNEALPLVVGFGVGWGAWVALRAAGVVTDEQQIEWYLRFIDAAHAVRYAWLPTPLRDALDGWPLFAVADPALVRAGLAGMKAEREGGGGDGDGGEKVAFRTVLLSCGVEEQLDWLAEHVEEAVPFIFTEELFHTWASLYFGLAFLGIPLPVLDEPSLPQPPSQPRGSAAAAADMWRALRRRSAALPASPHAPSALEGTDELPRGVWHRGVRGRVLSAESAWSTLAVLATAAPRTAVGVALHALNVQRRDDLVAASTRRLSESTASNGKVGGDGGGGGGDSVVSEEAVERALEGFVWRGSLTTEQQCVEAFRAVLLAAAHRTSGPSSTEDMRAFSPAVVETQVVRRPLSLAALADPAHRDAQDCQVRLAAARGASSAGSAVGAAAFDPMLLTLRAVDLALVAEARALRAAHYGLIWSRPLSWGRPLTRLFAAPPPPPAASLGGGVPSLFEAALRGDGGDGRGGDGGGGELPLRAWAGSYVAASAAVHGRTAAPAAGTDGGRVDATARDAEEWLETWRAKV